ncbi:MAG: hypothetical protein ACJ763_14225 [Bdellovibrionia bacterium]
MAIGLRGKRFLNTFAWIAAALALSQAPIPYSSSGNAPFIAAAAENSQKDLAQEIGQRITRVPEFQFIRDEAKRLGVRAYLFGGTAAGFAHYVNWDMKREGGDTRFQPDRFDYDYTDIYRSTQDLDIVIDGPPAKAQKLQQMLAENFPHLQGNKTAWEVRLLRQDMGDKQALLNNPEFLNQHTDSNSTGMIEITEPKEGDPVVRDLRDWTSRDPYFLRDVREGKLHYYFSDKHAQTKFAKEGRNPPIISVIRYLTKAFQYELEIRPEDREQIKKITDEFDPRGRDIRNSYVRNWLLMKDNGRKLIQNAVNIEYAWNTLEELGLRKKLIAIENNPDTEGSLAWWMSKEPLRSYPLEKGTRTARELVARGLLPTDLTVAHETNNFLAYESMTRAHTGDPNVLISRRNKVGESAGLGNGFYTAIGRNGARHTGITIRFKMDPDAVEGVDFTFDRDTKFLVFHNKNALRVIPESLKLTPTQYFDFLANGEKIDPSERAIFEKLKRKVAAGRGSLTDEEYEQIQSIVKASIERDGFNEPLLKEWAALPKSADRSEVLFDPLLKTHVYDIPLSQLVFSQPQFAKLPKFSERHIETERLLKKLKKSAGTPEAYHSLLKKTLQTNPEDATRLAYIYPQYKDDAALSAMIHEVLPQIDDENFTLQVIRDSSKAELRNRVILFNQLVDRVLTQPHTKTWKQAKAGIIENLWNRDALSKLYEKVLSQPELTDEESTIHAIKATNEVVRRISKTTAEEFYQILLDKVLSKPLAKDWAEAQAEFFRLAPDTPTIRSFAKKIAKKTAQKTEKKIAKKNSACIVSSIKTSLGDPDAP